MFPTIALLALMQQSPPPHSESIVVTAQRTPTRIADTAASVVVLSSEELEASAAPTLDDALRQVPGFALFRRTGSRVANPTSQGASLRGIGASGASRALVLDDGVPLNDPFGGWVYWGRVPRAAIERVEIVRGGTSDLYGSNALSGVVQFFRRTPAAPTFIVEASAGAQQTATLSLFAGGTAGRWHHSIAADALSTDGYVLVDRNQRGPVDRKADSRHQALDGTLERIETWGRLFARLSHYGEARNNGTALQTNDTDSSQLAMGSDGSAYGGSLLIRIFGTRQAYRQTFSAVASDRASERLTADQSVPSRSAGLTTQWARSAGRHEVVGGLEGRQVSGTSDETLFTPAGMNRSAVDGTQRTLALFLHDRMRLSRRTSVGASIRWDEWRNMDADRNGVLLPDREQSSWSPRVSILHAAGVATWTLSAYRAFRAPTLNELYRNFRVGNVLTLANESLRAEVVEGAEGGVRVERNRASARVTLFHMRTSQSIANATLSSTPALITRQRQNIGESRSRGIELDAEWQAGSGGRLSVGYLLADSVVTSDSLRGKRLPQVPRHQLTLQGSIVRGSLTAATQFRWSGRQFDDDLNELPLDSFAVTDAFFKVPVGRRLSATAAIENLFDRRIEASATPVITLGQPRSWRVGLRYGS